MFNSRHIALLFVVLLCPIARGQGGDWEVVGASIQEEMPAGARLIKTKLESGSGKKVDLRYVVFDTRKAVLKIIDQGDEARPKYLGLADAMAKTGGIAGCNGGFFTPEFTPLGQTISGGKTKHAFDRKNSLLTGAVVVQSGKAKLLWRDEVKNGKGVTDLLQSGPRLVKGGKVVVGLSPRKQRRRTFVLTDGGNLWAIGYCASVSLKELAEILLVKEAVKEVPVKRALNLDGGPSSGLWAKPSSGVPQYVRELTPVRNFIGVVPRSAAGG